MAGDALRGVALISLLGACSSPKSPGTVDAPIATDAGIDTTSTVTLTETGLITDENLAPIAGATICALYTPQAPCAQTNADGTYDLAVAFSVGDADIAERMTASGYLGAERLVHESAQAKLWSKNAYLYSDAAATTYFATQAGFAYPPTGTGFVRLSVESGTGSTAVLGATATVSSGAPAVYVDAGGTPDPSLQGTTQSGQILFGNLPPGTYTIEVQATNLQCTSLDQGLPVGGDWSPSGTATLRLDVTANTLTDQLRVICM